MLLVVFCLVLVHLGFRLYDHAADIRIFAAVILIANSSVVAVLPDLFMHLGNAVSDFLLGQLQCKRDIFITADAEGAFRTASS